MKNRRQKLRLAAKRDAHRNHAQLRFRQRFALTMGPPELREIERKIADSEAILVGKLPKVRNYLVAIGEKLIPIGYSTYSKRVVTALPEAYLTEIDPELISL